MKNFSSDVKPIPQVKDSSFSSKIKNIFIGPRQKPKEITEKELDN